MNVNIVQTKMEETSDASKQQGVDDVGAHHYFRLKTVKQQQHHHDNAARADRSDAHQEMCIRDRKRTMDEASGPGKDS